jgi:hypothetical protein
VLPKKETADVINSLGGEQDNVVFMGRRSFRMEIAGAARSNELPIPIPAATVPTEKIFEADRDRAAWIESAANAPALQPAKLKSNGTSVVALCVTTFVLGIALTLTFTGRAAPRRAPVAAPARPAPVAAPAQTAPQTAAPATTPKSTPAASMVVQPMPIAVPTDAEILAGFSLAPSRRPVAKPARAARPRPARAAQLGQSDDAEDATAADPFADPAPVAKPAAAKPAAVKQWVDPFAE